MSSKTERKAVADEDVLPLSISVAIGIDTMFKANSWEFGGHESFYSSY